MNWRNFKGSQLKDKEYEKAHISTFPLTDKRDKRDKSLPFVPIAPIAPGGKTENIEQAKIMCGETLRVARFEIESFLGERPFVNTEPLKQLLREADAIYPKVAQGEAPVSAYIAAVNAWKRAIIQTHKK